MNEIIEQYYQAEIDSDEKRLVTDAINKNWGRLMKMICSQSDDISQRDAAFNMIGDMVMESARNGFDTGFRAAFRFLMSL
ncbi:MAG: hypothetical protein IJ512_05580 [Ruminococcus sp.]|nr:hypothetical protein [Ruminococcus sp.]